MLRTDVINHLIQYHKYTSYLEIGVDNSELNYDKIQCAHKEGVDPDPAAKATHQMTSDEFFATIKSEKYDIIFIDGLHDAKQVMQDVENALKHLSDKGFILLLDCNPKQEYLQISQEEYDKNGVHDVWCGDVWKALARLRMTRDDLNCSVIDRDFGIGVIERDGQTIFPDAREIDDMDWDFLEANRTKLLNIKGVPSWME